MGETIQKFTAEVLSVALRISEGISGLCTTFHTLARSPSDGEFFILSDAAGREHPIHFRTVTSWAILRFILQDKFKGSKGQHRVLRGKYLLQGRSTGRDINFRMDWDNAFLPYQRVDMSVMCEDVRCILVTKSLKERFWVLKPHAEVSCPCCGTKSPYYGGNTIKKAHQW
jgi:hypothetical protein